MAAALDKIDPNWPQSEVARQRVPVFIAALQDRYYNYSVRQAAAAALGQIGDARAVESLIAALRDRNSAVRQAAAEALGRIGDTHAVEPLIAELRDGYSNVRQAAAEALVKIGLPAVEPLITALRHQDSTVRLAVSALLQTHWPTWVHPLLDSYPHLLCKLHHVRAKRQTVRLGFLTWKTIVVCRHCGRLADLQTGVNEVVGLVGGPWQDFSLQQGTAYLSLWNPAIQTARYADIDRLCIRLDADTHFEMALDSVILALRNDASRSSQWCKAIPVHLEGDIALPTGAMTKLQQHFKSVERVTAVCFSQGP